MAIFTHEELAPSIGDDTMVYRVLNTANNSEQQVTLRERMGEDFRYRREPTEHYGVNWVEVDENTGEIHHLKGMLMPVHIDNILGKVER